MEISPSDAIALGGLLATGLAGAIAYGTLKNRVCSLEKRADGAKSDREKLFDSVSSLRTDTDVQQEKLSYLEGAREELFRLAKDTNDAINNISTSLKVLSQSVRQLEEQMRGQG